MMDGEDSKAGMASPDLQKQLADLTNIVEMQVQAMTLQSQMMSLLPVLVCLVTEHCRHIRSRQA